MLDISYQQTSWLYSYNDVITYGYIDCTLSIAYISI